MQLTKKQKYLLSMADEVFLNIDRWKRIDSLYGTSYQYNSFNISNCDGYTIIKGRYGTVIYDKECILDTIIVKDGKYQIGDKVKIIIDNEYGFYNAGETGIIRDINNILLIDFDEYNELRCIDGKKNSAFVLEQEIELIHDIKESNTMKIKVKYFDGATKLKKIEKGNWIDCYANKDIFIPQHERAMIPLGFALELPKGWEGHLAPRSSTFKTWGIIQTNSVGIVDDTYIGNDDQWHFPAFCLDPKHKDTTGTWIKKGDKICQFRIMECQPDLEFIEVDKLEGINRGGFGTTGIK